METGRQLRKAIKASQDVIEFDFSREIISANVRVPFMGVHALSFGRPVRGETARERLANFLRDLADGIESLETPSDRWNNAAVKAANDGNVVAAGLFALLGSEASRG